VDRSIRRLGHLGRSVEHSYGDCVVVVVKDFGEIVIDLSIGDAELQVLEYRSRSFVFRFPDTFRYSQLRMA
jgi:hypothetical protein